MLDQTALAAMIAADAHYGQFDKSGHNYISHPMRVAFSLENAEDRPVALLHDVLEDTSVTHDDLLNWGVEFEIVTDVIMLSKRYVVPDETNREYRERILTQGTPRALRVKRADLLDNLRTDRVYGRPKNDTGIWVAPSGMRSKYEDFFHAINDRLAELTPHT